MSISDEDEDEDDGCTDILIAFNNRISKSSNFFCKRQGLLFCEMNRKHDDCDSMMTILLATEPFNSLVICPDKRGDIAPFIACREGRRKRNLKCVRYSVNGESRVFLVATRDIAEGEQLYYDYNGYEDEYPTQHFI